MKKDRKITHSVREHEYFSIIPLCVHSLWDDRSCEKTSQVYCRNCIYLGCFKIRSKGYIESNDIFTRQKNCCRLGRCKIFSVCLFVCLLNLSLSSPMWTRRQLLTTNNYFQRSAYQHLFWFGWMVHVHVSVARFSSIIAIKCYVMSCRFRHVSQL